MPEARLGARKARASSPKPQGHQGTNYITCRVGSPEATFEEAGV